MARLSLRAKLALLLLLGGVLPLFLATTLSVLREKAAAQSAARELLRARTEQVGGLIEERDLGYLQAVQRISFAPDIEAYCRATPEERKAQEQRIHTRLLRYVSGWQEVRGLGIVDRDGTVVNATEAPLLGRNYGFRQYLRRAFSGELVASDIYVAVPEVQSAPSIAYAAPIRDGSGRVGCAAVLWIRAETFWSILEAANGAVGAGSYSILIDGLGFRIGHSNPEAGQRLLFHPTRPVSPDKRAELLADQRFGPRTAELLEAVVPFQQLTEGTEDGVFRRFSPANRVWNEGYQRRLRRGWHVISMVPEKSLNSYLWPLLRQVALALGLGLGMAALGALLLMRQVVRPLRELATAAEAIADSPEALDLAVPVRGHDELSSLGTAFNSMIRRLRARSEELREQQRQLTLARDAAQAAARAKANFLANMSHEIRTPLNGVLGMLHLLLETPLDPEQRSWAETARSSGDALLDIVNDVLDLSKIEAGRMELESIDFDLRQLIDETIESFADRAASKELELTSFVSPEVPAGVRSDPTRLRQVLGNLLGNAIKFTAKGEVVLRVRLAQEARAAEPAVLYFEVQDTGPGIERRMRERLFESFTQGDSSTTRQHGGTGLGLAISRQLVTLLSGQLGVDSEPGVGSRFWFTMRARTSAQAPASVDLSGSLAGFRVLVVDDNATNREIFDRQTRSWGAESAQAAGAIQALALLREAVAAGRPFHAAIIDYHMPETDGLSLARAIRADPALSGLRLLMAASFGQPWQQTKAKEAGVEVCLTKPVRARRLREELLRFHGQRPAAPVEDLAASRAPVEPLRTVVGARLLVAEDNPVNQRIAKRMLERMGCEVTLASDGLQAIAAVQAGGFDGILMDCQMPNLDGYAATRKLREDGVTLPIIAMTANAMEGDREKCLAAGMNDYVPKPVVAAELSRALTRWVRPRDPGSPHASAAAAQEPAGPPPPAAPRVAPPGAGELAPAAAAAELDERTLARLRALDNGALGLLQDLTRLFADEWQSTRLSMDKALASRDAKEFGRRAHGLKGSSANLGAVAVSRLCGLLEQAALLDDWEGLEDLWRELPGQVEAALSALRAVR